MKISEQMGYGSKTLYIASSSDLLHCLKLVDLLLKNFLKIIIDISNILLGLKVNSNTNAFKTRKIGFIAEKTLFINVIH